MNFEESYRALERAKDALENSVHNLHGGFIMGTVNRAYYTMFHCMGALLATKETYSKTHQGVRSKFNEIFIKTSILPIHIVKQIGRAFDLRQDADYDLDASITEEEAQILVDNAKEFYIVTKEYLSKLG